jgi:hypothetical protein
MRARGCGVSRAIAVEKSPLGTADSTLLLIQLSDGIDDKYGSGVKEYAF